MEAILHKQAYNISIREWGERLVWMWNGHPFAFRWEGVIYYTHAYITKEKVGEYLHLIKQMEGEIVHLGPHHFMWKYRELFESRVAKLELLGF